MKKNPDSEQAQHPYVRRLIAFLIDWYTSSFLAMMPILVFQSINGKDLVLANRVDTLPPVQAVTATALALVIYTWYFCIFPLRQHGNFEAGQTLGRRVLNITLIKAAGSKLTFRDLFIRDFIGILLLQGNTTSVNIYLIALVGMFTGSASFVPYLQSIYTLILVVSWIMLFARQKQTLHDRLSGTRMILAKTDEKISTQEVESNPAP